jgi:hypothetical protein
MVLLDDQRVDPSNPVVRALKPKSNFMRRSLSRIVERDATTRFLVAHGS